MERASNIHVVAQEAVVGRLHTVALVLEGQGDERVDAPRHVAVYRDLVGRPRAQMRVALAGNAVDVNLRVHGDVHAPLLVLYFAKIRILFNIGREPSRQPCRYRDYLTHANAFSSLAKGLPILPVPQDKGLTRRRCGISKEVIESPLTKLSFLNYYMLQTS